MSRPYLQHGRRHGPEGSDPIPTFGGVQAAQLQFFGSPVTLGGSASQNIAWTTFNTSDQTVFGTNTLGLGQAATNTTGDTWLLLLQPGLYLAVGAAGWESGTYPSATVIDFATIAGVGDLTAFTGYSASEALATTVLGASDQIYPQSVQATWVNPGDTNALVLDIHNRDSSSRTVSAALLSCFFWPSSEDLASIY